MNDYGFIPECRDFQETSMSNKCKVDTIYTRDVRTVQQILVLLPKIN